MTAREETRRAGSLSRAGAEPRPRPGDRRRRRLVTFLAAFLVLVPLAVLVNLGPYREYAESREKLQGKQAEVALIEEEIAHLQGELGRLETDAHLEALARKELAYARPGEEVFIVKGLSAKTESTVPTPPPPETGPVERLVDSLRSLF